MLAELTAITPDGPTEIVPMAVAEQVLLDPVTV
jgi:hypothetical protein